MPLSISLSLCLFLSLVYCFVPGRRFKGTREETLRIFEDLADAGGDDLLGEHADSEKDRSGAHHII